MTAYASAVVEAIRDGVVVVGGNDRVRSVNAAIERGLGVERGAVLDSPLETLFSAGSVPPREVAELRRAIAEVRAGEGHAREVEMTYTDDEGRERVGIVRLTAIEGGPAVAGIVRDVTDRREHERVLASLHEVTRLLVRADEPREICAVAVHAGSDLLDLPISGVWLLDEGGYLEPIAGTAGAHDEFGGLPRFGPGEGLVWDAFESGEPELYSDLREVEGLYNPESPIRSEIIAPIGEHGVLMTGSFEPHDFDEADLDLFSTLVENTRAALDRAERDRLLRERADRIAAQADRLEAVADALSTDVDRELEGIEAALDGEADGGGPPPEERIDRIRELVADVREVASEATGAGRRERVELETALEAAIAESRADPERAVLENGESLRAAPGRLGSLLASALDGASEQTGSPGSIRTVRLGTLDGDERGFFLAVEGDVDGRGEDTGADGTDGNDGLDLAVARAVADAHGWRLSVGDGRIEVRGVATLEP